MHFLVKLAALAVILSGAGLIGFTIYMFPVVAVLIFLCSVVLILVLQIKKGEGKRAWSQLLRSLFLDW